MRKQLFINLVLFVVIIALGLVVWLDPFSETGDDTATPLTQAIPSDITKISLSRGTEIVFTLEKQDIPSETVWYLTHPLKMPANSIKVDQLLELLSTNSFRQYRIKFDNFAKLGLQQPEWEILFSSGDSETRIQFGKTDPIGQKRYVLVNDTVNLINDRYSQYNFGSPLMLANLDILPVDKSVKELHLPGKIIRKVDGQWQSNNSGDSISQDTYKEFIDEWRYAQALRVTLADKTDLSNEAQPVTVVLEQAEQPVHFTIEATEQDYIVTNKDWGVRYYLNSSVGEKLLQLNSPHHE